MKAYPYEIRSKAVLKAVTPLFENVTPSIANEGWSFIKNPTRKVLIAV